MSKIAAEKRTRTYSIDDHALASVHTDVHDSDKVPEVLALTKKSSHSSLHNKFLDVDGGSGPRSRQASFSMTASQRSIARRNAANPFARAVSYVIRLCTGDKFNKIVLFFYADVS